MLRPHILTAMMPILNAITEAVGAKEARFAARCLLSRVREFVLPKLRRIGEFLLWQGITVSGNLLFGLLCVRLLPVGEYAKYVVTFSVQGSLVVLMDVGITGSLIPLIGDRIDDRRLIADFVASLRKIARWMYAIAAPVAVLVYLLLLRNPNWDWQTLAAMLAVLLVSVWFARVGATYGTVLILRRDRKCWYKVQMISSFGTLIVLGAFSGLHWLNAFSAILINVSGVIAVALAYFVRSRQLLGVAGSPSRSKCRAIVQFALPSIPSVIYYAFQGPLSVMLIAIFGHSASVASVGALSRLSQLFVLFAQMNPLLVEPYFARLPSDRLKQHYLAALAMAGGFCFTAICFARFMPEAFLWILGPKYSTLQHEVLIVIATGALGFLGSVMACINGSRRFVYYWDNVARNVLTLLVQAAFLWKADMSNVRSVLWFGFVTVLPSFVIHFLVVFYGFARGPRRIEGLNDCLEQG